MEARLYTPEDLAEVNSWLKARELPPNPLNPPRGIMVPGVAVGFIVLMEASFAMIDGFCTNPNAHWEDRRDGLSLVCEGLMSIAKENMVKYCVLMTRDSSIERRALEYGFTTKLESVKVMYRSL